jgi:hypothetical protein
VARFDRLKYPVHKLKPGETVDAAFPDLFKKPEFKALKASKKHAADYGRLVKYIIFLYDMNSDLVDEFRSDLKARKDAAATEAGFERVKGKWPDAVLKVMNIRDQDAYLAILAYLQMQKYPIWQEIVITEQELAEFNRIRFVAIKKTDDQIAAANAKDKLKEKCESRIKSLASLYKQFFEDHTDVQKAEFEEQITPENAERILETEGAPYEEIKS